MALRAVRRGTTSKNALDWVMTSTQIAANVTVLVPFPPTMAAATLLLSILQIINVSNPSRVPSHLLFFGSAMRCCTLGIPSVECIPLGLWVLPRLAPLFCTHTAPQDIKTSQQECFRLAHRAARLLIVLGRRMEGKWDDAPESLLENIREFEA